MFSEDNALRQATMTADTYLAHAKRSIDNEFGDGFAASNPSLVATYMTVCATDLATAYKHLEYEGTLSSMNSAANNMRARV
jgi:hypothetical protein